MLAADAIDHWLIELPTPPCPFIRPVYDEQPSRMVITCRGSRGNSPALWRLPFSDRSPGAGVTVVDISEPQRPVVLERWDAPNRVEGQDRRGDLLVVTNIGKRTPT